MLPKLFLLSMLTHLSKSDYNFELIKQKSVNNSDFSSCFRDYLRMSNYSRNKMFDSSSKLLHGGLLQGNIIDLGFYDECVSIAQNSEEIYGKYCMMTLSKGNSSMKKTQQKSPLSQILGVLSFGICVPDKCTAGDMKKILPLEMNDDKCFTKLTNNKMNTGAVVAMIVILSFIVIAILSTIYDFILEQKGQEPKLLIFISFSMYTNGKKLMKKSTSSSQINCLAGIKVLSMIWVVVGHTFLNLTWLSLDNFFDVNDWLDDPKNMIVMGATVTVDTFFTIGGLLVTYVFMMSTEMEVMESFKKVPLLYLHRYIRLTPAFAMMIFVYGSGLIKYLGDGPTWNALNTCVYNCRHYWWKALLYIHNYSSSGTMCVGQSWYLASDFQLFLVTPLILIPLRKYPKYVLPFLYVLTAIGIVIPFCMGVTNKNNGVGLDMVTTFFLDEYYYRTYVRFAPYVIGMIMGYYIHKLKSEEKPFSLKTNQLIFIWIFSLSTLLFCIFDGYKLVRNDQDKWWDGIYMGFNRSIWSLAICVVILLCSTGNGGYINDFLSMRIFQIMAKLSYSMYLVHYIVITIIYASRRTSLHFTNFAVFSQFFTIFLVTTFISVFYVLLFESPMITIERIIFNPKSTRRTK